MAWIIASLGTAIIFTIGNIIDSHVISKKVPNLSPVLFVLGIAQLIIACIVLAVFHFPTNAGVTHILVAVGAGLLTALALMILLNCLQKGEVSRVIPVICSSPIFVALLSMPLLRETLNLWEWLAILLAVAGAVLISLQRDEGVKNQAAEVVLSTASRRICIGSVQCGLQVCFGNPLVLEHGHG